MHNFEQVKDVLQYGMSVHAELRRFYDSIRNRQKQVPVIMLLDYLSSHEKLLEEMTGRLLQDSPRRVLDTWMQYAPSTDVKPLMNRAQFSGSLAVEQVVALASECCDAVASLYRDAARECDIANLQNIFHDLEILQTSQKTKLLHAALFEDM